MADITVKGQNFLGVPDVTFQKVGGGTATFYENGGGAPNLQTKNKTYTPSGSQQTEQVHADNGYDGLDEVNVTVNAVPAADINGTLHSAEFITKNGNRIFEIDVRAYCETEGWVDEGAQGSANLTDYAAIPAGTSVTPTESAQTIGDYKTMMEDEITVNAIPSNYVGTGVPRDVLPASLASTPTGTRKAVITQNADGAKYLNIPAGYNSTDQYYELPQFPVGPKTITQNGTYDAFALDDLVGYSTVLVNVSGSSRTVQIAQGVNRVNTTTYTAVSGQSITVAKTGTYDVYWSGFRSSTGGTNGSQLYIGETAYGSAQTTFSNHGQSVHLENVSLTSGQTISVRARARGTSYYMYVANLTIIEKI